MTYLPDLKNENRWPASGVDWEYVWPQNRRWLATVLLARGVESGAVEEVLQEVGAAAVAGADRLCDAGKVASWLYRIAALKALQYRRRQGRRRKLIDRYAMSHGDALDRTEPEPLDWLLAEEQKQLVRQALARLAPELAKR